MNTQTDSTVLRSADSHIIEPADLWQTRVPQSLRDRAPRVVDSVDSLRGKIEGEWMVCEGLVPQRIAGFAAADVADPRTRADADQRGYAEIRPGAWNPAERLKDQDVDGVGFEVVYPSMALPMFGIPDTELQYAVFGAYNDWIAEFTAYDPRRMLGVGMICLDTIDRAVAELERVAKLGLRGAMIAVDPGKPNYGSARYDKVWAAASALELPLSMHILTRREGAGYHRLPFLMTWMGHSHPVQLSITAMLVSGVFHRFPDLRIVSVENDIGWIPHYLYKLEDAFEQFQYFLGYDLPNSPIEYFHRNVWFTFQDDPIGVQHLDMIGTHQVMWGSDYPHGDSTWPKSRETVARNFDGMPATVVRQVTFDNVTALYGLDS